MSAHVFHEIYLHLTWHTKDNYPLLTPQFEIEVHNFLRDRCRQTDDVYFHSVGGTKTHVHLAINIEPHVTISDLVGELKGVSSHDLNKIYRMKRLQWQRGFGVVSFGKKQLPWVVRYIANQKEHHAQRTTESQLERISFDDEGNRFRR